MDLLPESVKVGVMEKVATAVVVTLRDKERVGENVRDEEVLWEVEGLRDPLWDAVAVVDVDKEALLDTVLVRVEVVKGEVVAKFVDTMGVAEVVIDWVGLHGGSNTSPREVQNRRPQVQLKGVDKPGDGQKEPTGQNKQEEFDAAPDVGLYVPAKQRVGLMEEKGQ